jgi:hypothetical protein
MNQKLPTQQFIASDLEVLEKMEKDSPFSLLRYCFSCATTNNNYVG